MKVWKVLLFFAALAVVAALSGCQQATPLSAADARSLAKGLTGNNQTAAFDEFGFNYTARIFVGAADGVDRILDGKVWGDPTYANDHLVMKWSKAWDDARFNAQPWTPEAWEDNEWNGKVPGGSGEVWHYKIIWVGSDLESSQYWRPGGYAIWDQFEVILDQGVSGGGHSWNAHALPTGYGPN